MNRVAKRSAVDQKDFIKIAHKHLVFRDDWDFIRTRILAEGEPEPPPRWSFPPRKLLRDTMVSFRSSLERASELAAVPKVPILIRGPLYSGTSELARAIAEADAPDREPLVIDCGQDKETSASLANPSGLSRYGTLIVERIEEASPAFQRVLLHEFEVRMILTSALEGYELERLASNGKFLRELSQAVQGSTVSLPSVQHRLWDAVPLIVSCLTETQQSPIEYLSYNVLEFLVWYFWYTQSISPRAGTIPKFRQILADLVRRGKDGLHTVNLKRLETYFPIGDGRQVRTYPPSDVYHLINDWPGPGYPLVAMGWPKIEAAFPRVEIARYLLERCYLPKEDHEVTPPRQEGWCTETWRCSPAYDVSEVSRQVEFLETGADYFGRFLSLDWLRDQDVEHVRAPRGKPTDLNTAEQILFDLRKLRGHFGDILRVRKIGESDARKHLLRSSTDTDGIGDFCPKWFPKNRQAREELTEIFESFFGGYRKDHRDDPYAQELLTRTKVRRRQFLINEALKGWHGKMTKSTLKKKYFYPRRIMEYGRCLSRRALKR